MTTPNLNTFFENAILTNSIFKQKIKSSEVDKKMTSISTHTKDFDLGYKICSILNFISINYLSILDEMKVHPVGSATLMREFVEELTNTFSPNTNFSILPTCDVKTIIFLTNNVFVHIDGIDIPMELTKLAEHRREFDAAFVSCLEKVNELKATETTTAVDTIISNITEELDDPNWKVYTDEGLLAMKKYIDNKFAALDKSS